MSGKWPVIAWILATLTLAGALLELWSDLPVGAFSAVVVVLGVGVVIVGWLGRAAVEPEWAASSARVWWFGVIGLTVIAIAVRWWTLTDRTVWDDEMWTLRIVYGGSLLDVLRICVEDYWPPLHYLVQNIACRLGDTGVLTLRLPSLIAGAVTVPAVIWLARTLDMRRTTALFAGLLLAVSVPHVLRSQESRVYALQIALIVWSYAALWRGLPKQRISWSYVCATTLVMYSHQLSFLVLLAQWAFLGAAKWGLRVPVSVSTQLRAQLAVAGLTAPLFLSFLVFRLAQSEVEVPLGWASGEHELNFWLLIEMIQTLAVRSWSGILLLLLLGLVALVRCGVSQKIADPGDAVVDPPKTANRHVLLLLLCWLIVPVCATFLISWLTPLKVFGVQRYHLFLTPALVLLLALGFDQLHAWGIRVVLTAAAGVIGIHDLYGYYTRFERVPYDRVAAHVREHRVAGEMIYVGNGYRVFSYYYKGQYPRIGSTQWHEFAAQFDALDHLWTDDPDKVGSSYRSEKLPAFIEHLFLGSPNRSYVNDIVELRSAGKLRFEGSYWLVLGDGQIRQLMDDLDLLGSPCHPTHDTRIGSLRVVRCE